MTATPLSERRRLRAGLPAAALALVAYVPLLLSNAGQVGGDTKAYLTLDPSRWLSRVAYLWSPQIGAGGVTHQNIGYLWPMGPFFWVFDKLGVPMWVAQRLWLGSVLFAAGLGVLWLMRRFVDPRIAVAAAFFYMLSPYLLHYSERMSVLLLPWAGLPWLVGLTARARQERTWRAPAVFALVVATIGGINATSIILVGLGPVLWLLYTIVMPASSGTGEDRARRRTWLATATALRIGLLTLLTNAWWMSGLVLQGTYGLPVLGYTETYETVANATNASEMLRGLGHWFFYGSDRVGAWVQPSKTYTGNLGVLALSFLVPVLALLGLAMVRYRHRAFFIACTVVGLLVAVGGHPWDAPSVLGGLFKAFTRTETGLALRSTPRALPLMELGLAAGFGALTASLAAVVARWAGRRAAARAAASGGGAHRAPSRPAWVAGAVVALACLLVMANLSPLWRGQVSADTLSRDETIPDYWQEAAAAIDAGGNSTRVLELPGSDFAAYRWGDIVDPLTPGITDRPYLARELIPNGSPASASLLLALDRRYQENIQEDAALVPIAQLLGVGDIVLRNDLQYERFNTPRPWVMWNSLSNTPGLDPPVPFGPAGRNDAQPPQPLLDQLALNEPPTQPATSPVAIFPLQDPLPIVRTVPYASPMLVAGDGEGLVDLAALGLLDPQQAILFAGTFAGDPDGLQQPLDAGATLVVTDTNAKRGLRWGAIRENEGHIERVDESALRWDPSDNPLIVFPDQTTDSQTVAIQSGGTVDATAYANPVTYTAENRPYFAFDGDPSTSWKVAAFDEAVGERIVLTLDAPATIDHVDLQQTTGNRTITRARVTVGDTVTDVDLGPESQSAPGQRVSFPATQADHVSVEVLQTDPGNLSSYEAISPVGFAEITVPGVRVSEAIRLPTDLLGATGTDDLSHPLYLVVTRNRADPSSAGAGGRSDPERSMVRVVTLPSDRSYTLLGDVRVEATSTPEQLAALVGGTEGGGLASASSFLAGRTDRGRAAWDGDAATWWTPSLGGNDGAWVQLDAPSAASPGSLTVTFAADGRHSVPATLSVQADGATVATVDVPDAPDGPFGTTRSVTIPVPAGTSATSWRVSVDAVHSRMTNPWLGGADYELPVAIADVGGLGVAPAALRDTVDTGCRSDLVSVDGRPVPVRVTGSVSDALQRQPLHLLSCGDVAIPAGDATITTTPGTDTGLDVDRLAFTSLAGGGAVPAAATGSPDAVIAALRPAAPASTPDVTVTSESPDQVDLEVSGLTEQSWLVLGQSFSDGWSATSPELGDLGSPTLVQGYANGWELPASDGTVHVTLTWKPQKLVWAGIGTSVLGVLVCLAILGWALLRRRRGAGPDRPGTPGPEVPLSGADPVDPAREAVRSAPTRGWRAPVLLGGVVALVAVVAMPTGQPLALAAAALVLGVGTAAAARTGRGDRALGVLAPAALAVAGLYSVAKEWRGDYRNIDWPMVVEPVHVVGMAAIVALFAFGLLSSWRDERRAQGADPATMPSTAAPAAAGDTDVDGSPDA